MKKLITLLLLLMVFSSKAQVVQQWATIFATNGTNVQAVYDMTIDKSGNIYIAGYTDNNMGQDDASIVKISSEVSLCGTEHMVETAIRIGFIQLQLTIVEMFIRQVLLTIITMIKKLF